MVQFFSENPSTCLPFAVLLIDSKRHKPFAFLDHLNCIQHNLTFRQKGPAETTVEMRNWFREVFAVESMKAFSHLRKQFAITFHLSLPRWKAINWLRHLPRHNWMRKPFPTASPKSFLIGSAFSYCNGAKRRIHPNAHNGIANYTTI